MATECNSQLGIEQSDPLTYTIYMKRFHPNGLVAIKNEIVLNKYEIQEMAVLLDGIVKQIKEESARPSEISPDTPHPMTDQAAAEQVLQWLPKKKCPKCGSPYLPMDVWIYNHPNGWQVPGMKVKQWLSLQCHHCNYTNSANKLGLTHLRCNKCLVYLTEADLQFNEFHGLCGVCNQDKLYNTFEPEYHGDPNSELPQDQ